MYANMKLDIKVGDKITFELYMMEINKIEKEFKVQAIT